MIQKISIDVNGQQYSNVTYADVFQHLKLEYFRLLDAREHACERLGSLELIAFKSNRLFASVFFAVPASLEGRSSFLYLVDKEVERSRHIQVETGRYLRNRDMIHAMFSLVLFEQSIMDLEHAVVKYSGLEIEKMGTQARILKISLVIATVYATAGLASILRAVGPFARVIAAGGGSGKLATIFTMTLANGTINFVKNVSEFIGNAAYGIETKSAQGGLKIFIQLSFDFSIGFFISYFTSAATEKFQAYLMNKLGPWVGENIVQSYISKKISSYVPSKLKACSFAFMNAFIKHAQDHGSFDMGNECIMEKKIKEQVMRDLGIERLLLPSLDSAFGFPIEKQYKLSGHFVN